MGIAVTAVGTDEAGTSSPLNACDCLLEELSQGPTPLGGLGCGCSWYRAGHTAPRELLHVAQTLR